MKKYKTFYLDCPWNEKGSGKIKRGADKHYSILPKHDILKVIYQSGVFNPDKDCHLYLWATNNHLQDALFVMEALGFRYITNLVWSKDRIGLGQYFRGQHEILLFGVRGRMMTKKKLPTVVMAQRTLHSKKPVEIYELIEKCSPPPILRCLQETNMMSGIVGEMRFKHR